MTTTTYWSSDESETSNINGDNNDLKFKAPSFIRLFVIRRLVSSYIHAKDAPSIRETIKELTTIFKDKPVIKSRAFDILQHLVNGGIKKFMKIWYDERLQANVIEMIFNKIILIKFEKEYNQEITYCTENNASNMISIGTKYQNLVFNSKDLMCSIFQYLSIGYYFKIDYDLIRCGYVNSHWLYNSWDCNSIYHVYLTELAKQTLKYDEYRENSIKRMWQRISNAKSVYLYLNSISFHQKNRMQSLLNRLKLFTTVDKIQIVLKLGYSFNRSILKTLIGKCHNRIRYCDIMVDEYRDPENQFRPLKIMNARYIQIQNVCLYFIWSNKCQDLIIHNWSIDWCKFVIQHCDCSSIKYLEFNHVKCKNLNDELTHADKLVLKTFAIKFNNLKKLVLNFKDNVDQSVLSFWRLLKPIIFQNNVKVEVNMSYLQRDDCHKINQIVKEQRVKHL